MLKLQLQVYKQEIIVYCYPPERFSGCYLSIVDSHKAQMRGWQPSLTLLSLLTLIWNSIYIFLFCFLSISYNSLPSMISYPLTSLDWATPYFITDFLGFSSVLFQFIVLRLGRMIFLERQTDQVSLVFIILQRPPINKPFI